jgi:hypothetical protein
VPTYVEGRANILKLSEGALEQVDNELGVVEERFLIGVLGRRLSSSSSSLRPRFSGGGPLDTIPSFVISR